MTAPIDLVTGAFSYSGRFVAAQLLERGRGVRTPPNHGRHYASEMARHYRRAT